MHIRLVRSCRLDRAVTVTVRPAAAAQPPKLRLDDAARPTKYAARISVNPADPTFKGSIDIDLKINRATDTLWLNATELTIDKALVHRRRRHAFRRASSPAAKTSSASPSTSRCPPGAAKLHVEWKGPLSRKDDRGLFAQKEGDRWYAITQFEAIFARRVFPCFDEPSIKVPWQLTLEVPKALVGDLEHQRRRREVGARGHEDGRASRRRRRCRATSSPSPSGRTSSSTPAPPGRRRSRCASRRRSAAARTPRYAAKNAPVFVELLEKYFGIPFPYDKLDNVAIPITSTFGAMENAGMVTFALNHRSSPSRRRRSLHFERGFSETAAHEFAHQWFGDLGDDRVVGRHLAQRVVRHVDGGEDHRRVEAGVDASHRLRRRARARARHRHAGDARVRCASRSCRTTTSTTRSTPSPTRRASRCSAMFEHFVGAEKFRAGIRHYLTEHANGNATADDFIAAIAGAARAPR